METMFRTAINGFNRDDVVNFIEKCTANHTQEIKSLKEECEQQKGAFERTYKAASEKIQVLEEKNRQLTAELERVQSEHSDSNSHVVAAENKALKAELEATEKAMSEEIKRLQAKLDAAVNTDSAQTTGDSRADLEAALNCMESELDQMRLKLNASQTELADVKKTAAEECLGLREQINKLLGDLTAAKQTASPQVVDELKRENALLYRKLEQTQQSLDEATRLIVRNRTIESAQTINTKELEAYRRAELAERNAKQRAEEILRAARERVDEMARRADDIYDVAIKQINGSVGEINGILHCLNQQMGQVGDAVFQMEKSFVSLCPGNPGAVPGNGGGEAL